MSAVEELASAGDGVASDPAPVVLPGLDVADPRLWSRGIKKRRSVPVMGYTGTSGHGKSATMVRDTLPTLAMGRRVLSTVALLDPWTGNPHPLYVPFRSWRQLDDWFDGDVLMDEITTSMDSRDGSSMPKRVRRLIPQMRRRRVKVRWSGIDWDNCELRMRQMTQAVAMSRGHAPNKAALAREIDSLDMWAPNRLFMVTTYDAQRLNQSKDSAQLTQGEGAKAPARVKRAKVLNREAWWGPGSLAFRAYDTMDVVDVVDGSCPVCGGRIPDKVCKGHRDVIAVDL